MKLFATLLICLALVGCKGGHGPLEPQFEGQYLSRHNAYAAPVPPNPNVIYDGYPGVYQARSPQEQMLTRYIWDHALQKGINKAIRLTPTDMSSGFVADGMNYKLTPVSALHYSTRTETHCREINLAWRLEYFSGPWENITTLLCRMGPSGEWLPVI